jgi:hypothetical protein
MDGLALPPRDDLVKSTAILSKLSPFLKYPSTHPDKKRRNLVRTTIATKAQGV